MGRSVDGPDKLRLFERAVTASTNSIVITDPSLPDNPIVYVNPAFEKTTGYTMEEVVGLNCRFLQGDDHDQSALEELRASIREGRECRVVLRNYHKDGTRFWNELSVYPVRDEEGNLTNFVGVQNDVTERRRAEQELSEMRRAERRRIARDLHDIVLQDLSGALQSLRLSHLQANRSGGSPDFEEELEALRRATSGLRSAIYDLRHERGRPFVGSVESLVELNRQADPGRRLRLVVGEGFPESLPDELGVELLRVLQEALTNARRHSGARNTEVRLGTEEGKIVAEVVDDGRGLDPRSRGAGIGLSAMRERAEGLGGVIEVSGGPGEGTRVRVEVPLRDDIPAPRRL
jgi:PAS domain S-box-containing protein